MGTQCSNLLNNISHQTTRSKLLDFISKPLPQNNQINNQPNSHFDLGAKLQFIRHIEKQFIKEDSENILTFQKYPENRFVVQFVDSSHYRGYVSENGKRQKEGQQTWQDGTKYLGEWKENLPHGNGILISPEGYTFEGNWNRGVVEGFGKYFGKIGSYQGDWFQNQPHGQGVQTWQDGSLYEGNYKRGKKQGKGKYIWPDKSSYNGGWVSGKINGHGTYRYVDGRVYNGSFVDNKMHGKGTYTWPDGRKYIGFYENDKKSGKGRYIWPDGRYYEGEWRDGKRNGYGKVVFPNKVIKYGIWEDDQKIQEPVEVNQYLKTHQTQRDNDQYENQGYDESPSFRTLQTPKKKLSNPIQHTSSKPRLTLPRTQARPLYACQLSPYKQLKEYYQQYTGEKGNMKERVANRYKFINSPMKKFNEMQLNGGGSYLQMMLGKRNSTDGKRKGKGLRETETYKQGYRDRRRVSSFVEGSK